MLNEPPKAADVPGTTQLLVRIPTDIVEIAKGLAVYYGVDFDAFVSASMCLQVHSSLDGLGCDNWEDRANSLLDGEQEVPHAD